jgi:hypothetical protein
MHKYTVPALAVAYILHLQIVGWLGGFGGEENFTIVTVTALQGVP